MRDLAVTLVITTSLLACSPPAPRLEHAVANRSGDAEPTATTSAHVTTTTLEQGDDGRETPTLMEHAQGSVSQQDDGSDDQGETCPPLVSAATRATFDSAVTDAEAAKRATVHEGQKIRALRKRALQGYETACEANHGEACFRAGEAHQRRNRRRGNNRLAGSSASRYWKQSCDLCFWSGCVSHARAEDFHRTKYAMALLERPCKAGYGPACNTLALYYVEEIFPVLHPPPPDDTRSADLFRLACDAGDGIGCSNYAFRLDSGKGVTPDEERARRLFHKSCNLRYDRGCTESCRRGNKRDCYR